MTTWPPVWSAKSARMPLARTGPVVKGMCVTIFTTLEPTSVAVDSGLSETMTVRVRNDGDTVEEFRLSVVGDPAKWTQVAPDVLRLYPGDEGLATVVLSPPRAPDAIAGTFKLGILVRPQQNPELSNVAEGDVTVGPFLEMLAELVPVTARGRLSARFRLDVENRGNAPLPVGVSGQDDEDVLAFRAAPEATDIEPGRRRPVRVRVRPRGVKFFGQPERYQFALTVTPTQERLPVKAAPVPPAQLRGTFVRLPLIPKWLLVTLGVLTAGAAALAALWFVPRPPLASRAVAQQGLPTPPPAPLPAAQAPPPIPSPPPAAPSPSPSPAPSQSGAEQPEPNQGQQQQGGGENDRSREQVAPDLVTIRSAQNDQDITLQDGRTDDRTAAVLADDDKVLQLEANRFWTRVPFPDGTVAFAPSDTPGSVLEQTEGEAPVLLRTVAGGKAAVWAGQVGPLQRWRLQPVAEGVVQIVNSQTGGCLTEAGKDLQVQVRPCADQLGPIQRWRFLTPDTP